MSHSNPSNPTSASNTANRAITDRAHPFPPEITEHPTWKAIWRRLLAAPTNHEKSNEDKEGRAA